MDGIDRSWWFVRALGSSLSSDLTAIPQRLRVDLTHLMPSQLKMWE